MTPDDVMTRYPVICFIYIIFRVLDAAAYVLELDVLNVYLRLLFLGNF